MKIMVREYSKDGGIHVCLPPMAVTGGKGGNQTGAVSETHRQEAQKGNQISAFSETQEVVGPRSSRLFFPSQTFSS